MTTKTSLLAGVSFAHLNGIVTPPAAAAPPAPRAEDDDDEEAKLAERTSRKAKRRAKAKKRDEEDDGDDDPDEDDDDDSEEDDMKASSVTGRARARERVRIAAILGCPAAAKNPALAANLACKGTLPRRAAIAALTDAVAHLPAGRRGGLEARMAAEAPAGVPASAGSPAPQRPSERALALAETLRPGTTATARR